MELAQVTYQTSGAGAGVLFVYFLAFYAIAIIPYWVIFTKAGEEGWKALIPIYSTIVLLKVIGRPWWWILLFLIPIVNIVILIVMMHGLSVSFGHGAGFTVGLIFLSLIFLYILAFGSSTYRGPSAPGAAAATPPPPPPMPTA
jgi:hypothetical protein